MTRRGASWMLQAVVCVCVRACVCVCVCVNYTFYPYDAVRCELDAVGTVCDGGVKVTWKSSKS
jgi:hypothetical protein